MKGVQRTATLPFFTQITHLVTSVAVHVRDARQLFRNRDVGSLELEVKCIGAVGVGHQTILSGA